MDRAGPRDRWSFPGNRAVERPVKLEHARAVTITLEPPTVAIAKTPARDSENALRHEVKKDALRLRESLDIGYLLIATNFATQGFDPPAQLTRNFAQSPPGKRPAAAMRRNKHEEAEGGG